jgi:predicted phosphodiesterase
VGQLPERWWQDKDTFMRVLAEHGTPVKASAATGIAPNTLSKWRSRHGLPKLNPGVPAKSIPVVASDDPDELAVLGALKQLGDQATVEQLADAADMAPGRVRAALERAGHDGYRVETDAEAVRLARRPTDTGERHEFSPKLFQGDTMRFGVVSDTHLSSIAQRPDAIETAYDIFVDEGVVDVFHVGDLTDGLGIFGGHISELLRHTYEAQVDYATDTYPRREGVTTRIIGGNHDLEGEFGKAGADPVLAVCNRRPDMEYLGRYSAWVDLPNGATMQMLHPQGGASYATSYRPQKIAESYEAGSKPNVLLIGHWHRTGYFMVRGIQTMLAGTFQGPTTYSTRKGMGEAGWGFWIVECCLADDGSVVRFKPEWLPFYAGRNT